MCRGSHRGVVWNCWQNRMQCIHAQNTHSDICRRRMELGQVAEMPRHASEAEMTKVSKVIQTNRLMYFGYLLLACLGWPWQPPVDHRALTFRNWAGCCSMTGRYVHEKMQLIYFSPWVCVSVCVCTSKCLARIHAQIMKRSGILSRALLSLK